MIKHLLLDRDGTINRDRGYVQKPHEIELLPGVVEGLAKLRDAGVRFYIITNQGALGKGTDTMENYKTVAKCIEDLLRAHDIHIMHTYYCPNAEPDAHRRKPNVGMWTDVQNDFPDVRPADCVMVGDKDADIQFGQNIGCTTARIITDAYPMTIEADYTVKDLNELASLLPL